MRILTKMIPNLQSRCKDTIMLRTHYNILRSIYNGLKAKNSHSVSKEVNMTTTHTHKLICIFVEMGLVNKSELSGRSKDLSLTKKGQDVLYHLNKINEVLQ